MKDMQKIDANICLRYLLGDHVILSPKAKELIEQNTVEVPIEILCEVVYVLKGHYKIERQNIAVTLKGFFVKTRCILQHKKAVFLALDYFGSNNLDFTDCLLAGYNEIEKDEIFTFDSKLQKLLDRIQQSE